MGGVTWRGGGGSDQEGSLGEWLEGGFATVNMQTSFLFPSMSADKSRITVSFSLTHLFW